MPDLKFKEAAGKSSTVRELLISIGLSPKGGKALNIPVPGTKNKNPIIRVPTVKANIDDKTFADAVSKCLSMSALFRLLNLPDTSAKRKWAKKKIHILHLDTGHWTGQAYFKNKEKLGARKNGEQLLRELEIAKSINTYKVKLILIREKVIEDKCQKCNLRSWLGEKISLHLHHVDGDRSNNKITNLQLLCPNCHSLTDNYCGKNKQQNKAMHDIE